MSPVPRRTQPQSGHGLGWWGELAAWGVSPWFQAPSEDGVLLAASPGGTEWPASRHQQDDSFPFSTSAPACVPGRIPNRLGMSRQAFLPALTVYQASDWAPRLPRLAGGAPCSPERPRSHPRVPP